MVHCKASSLQLYWQKLRTFLVSEASQRDSPKDQMLAAAERPGEGMQHPLVWDTAGAEDAAVPWAAPAPSICCPAPSHHNCRAVTVPCWWDSKEGLLEKQPRGCEHVGGRSDFLVLSLTWIHA